VCRGEEPSAAAGVDAIRASYAGGTPPVAARSASPNRPAAYMSSAEAVEHCLRGGFVELQHRGAPTTDPDGGQHHGLHLGRSELADQRERLAHAETGVDNQL